MRLAHFTQRLKQKTLGGTPCAVSQVCLHLLPRVTGFGVSFELFQPLLEFCLYFWSDFNSFRNGGNAFPDKLNKADTLLHGKFKDFGNGDLFHGQ